MFMFLMGKFYIRNLTLDHFHVTNLFSGFTQEMNTKCIKNLTFITELDLYTNQFIHLTNLQSLTLDVGRQSLNQIQHLNLSTFKQLHYLELQICDEFEQELVKLPDKIVDEIRQLATLK